MVGAKARKRKVNRSLQNLFISNTNIIKHYSIVKVFSKSKLEGQGTKKRPVRGEAERALI